MKIRNEKILKDINLESERQIEKATIDWVRNHPKISPYVIKIPNEGRRSPQYGKHLKDCGMRKGASDLFIAIANHGYHGAFIELKKINGRLSEDQFKFLNDMSLNNYFTAVCFGFDNAIKTIKWYCLDKN